MASIPAAYIAGEKKSDDSELAEVTDTLAKAESGSFSALEIRLRSRET